MLCCCRYDVQPDVLCLNVPCIRAKSAVCEARPSSISPPFRAACASARATSRARGRVTRALLVDLIRFCRPGVRLVLHHLPPIRTCFDAVFTLSFSPRRLFLLSSPFKTTRVPRVIAPRTQRMLAARGVVQRAASSARGAAGASVMFFAAHGVMLIAAWQAPALSALLSAAAKGACAAALC